MKNNEERMHSLHTKAFPDVNTLEIKQVLQDIIPFPLDSSAQQMLW